MFGFQTLARLHDIPVIRSSTDIVQTVYAKAKDTSALIRVPCNVAENVAEKSLKIALTVANPLVKPLREPVRAIDDYAAGKIRQMESKYPSINTPTEDVLHTLNEKTEPVRLAVNSVKDRTNSTIQHGKETVSNMADSVRTFCEGKVSAVQRGEYSQVNGRLSSHLGCLYNSTLEKVETTTVWLRMLVVFFLLKVKQINDVVVTKVPRQLVVPQRVFILVGATLDYLVGRVRPDDRTLSEMKKTKQQTRVSQQTQYFANRPNLKPDPSVNTRQGKDGVPVVRANGLHVSPQPLTDADELHARLAETNPEYSVTNGYYDASNVDYEINPDIAQLRDNLHLTDRELLYSRLPGDVLNAADHAADNQPLTRDQQQLHARVIGKALQEQGHDN